METDEKRRIYYLAQRLMMGNLLLWFGAGAFRYKGQITIWPIAAGFAFSLVGTFYYFNKLRRIATGSDS